MNRVISKEGEGTVFGNSPFELQERDAIQKVLQTDGSSASVGTHQSKTTCTKSSKDTGSQIANSLFKFNGWSDRIINLNVDYIEQELTLWSIGVTAIVRVVLKDGTFHENIGFAEAKNVSKGAALQEAKTNAVENARQRCLRLFGECFSTSSSTQVESDSENLPSTGSQTDVVSSQAKLAKSGESKEEADEGRQPLYDKTPETPETPESSREHTLSAMEQAASISQSMLDVLSNIEEFDKIEAEVQCATDSPIMSSSASIAKLQPSFQAKLPLRNQAIVQNPSVSTRDQTYGLSLPNNQSIPIQNGLAMKRNNTFISFC